MTETDFLHMLRENYYDSPVPLLSKTGLNKAKERSVHLVKFDVVQDHFVYYARCKKARLYYLKSFSAFNVEVKEVYVLFFNEELIYIMSDFSPELSNDLMRRYNTAQPKAIVSASDCKNAKGIQQGYPYNILPKELQDKPLEVSMDFFFREDTVSAHGSLKRFYNADCQLQNVNIFTLRYSKPFEQYVKCH